MAERSDEERREIHEEFRQRVNMTPKALEAWLETEESRSVGAKEDGGESVGHASGRRILAIQRKRKSELSDADYDHMAKVIHYVKRHTAQGPSKSDAEDSRWRYSLMSWGHDSLDRG